MEYSRTLAHGPEAPGYRYPPPSTHPIIRRHPDTGAPTVCEWERVRIEFGAILTDPQINIEALLLPEPSLVVVGAMMVVQISVRMQRVWSG